MLAHLYYFHCINSYVEYNKFKEVVFDGTIPFKKSSFHNRTILAGAQGTLTLSIPISGGRKVRQSYNEVMIDYSSQWQRVHYLTLCTLYGKSPFFLNYRDELKILFKRRPLFLFDWNLECFNWVNEKFKSNLNVVVSEVSQRPDINQNTNHKFLPNNYSHEVHQPFLRYRQVFEDIQGFKPNLSVLDLLFNQGPRFINNEKLF